MLGKLFFGRTGRKSSTGQRRLAGKRRSQGGGRPLQLESLENRTLLSASGGLASLLGAGSAAPALLGPATPGKPSNVSAAAQLSLHVPPAVALGTPVTVTVDAFTASGRLATGYNGTLTVGSTLAATYPTNIGFKHGVATFKVKFTAAGQTVLSVSAAATTNSPLPLSAMTDTEVVDPTVLTNLVLFLPGKVALGALVTVKVVAENGLGKPIAGYGDTLTITSTNDVLSGTPTVVWNTDPKTGENTGVGTFQVTFNTAITSANLTVTDNTLASPVSGAATTDVVDPKIVTGFKVALRPVVQVNKATTVKVIAINGLGQRTDFTGSVDVESLSDPTADSSISLVTGFTDGVATYSVTFDKTGLQNLVVTEVGNTSVTQKAWTYVR